MTGQNSFVVTLEKNFYRLAHYSLVENINKSAFISHALDSMEVDTVWHRCKIECSIPADASLNVAYFASNHNTLEYKGMEHNLDEIIFTSLVDSREKEALLANRWQEIIVNGADFPLHKARGRFIWFKIELISYDGEKPEIKDIKIEFPLKPITDYLPEIYQRDEKSYDVLNRFLGIFQALMDDLDESIEDVSRYLDLEQVNLEFLYWLSSWLKIDNYHIWPEEKLRVLLRNASQLYQLKGTRFSIEKIVEMYTGEKPFIVESFAVEEYRSSLYKRLYGDNKYTFTVLVKEHLLPFSQHYIELKQVINSFKPAHTLLNLVVLRPYLLLDNYVYLGVNSVLAGSGSLVLDNRATIPYDTSLEGMEDG